MTLEESIKHKEELLQHTGLTNQDRKKIKKSLAKKLRQQKEKEC